MKKILIWHPYFLWVILLLSLFYSCTPAWDENAIKIERFEYLDAVRENYDVNDSLLVEAYLIHNYYDKHDAKIQQITDKFVCDSIVPNSSFPRLRYITFFKKTKNTNRENFRTLPKHKNIYARSNDKLFSYRIRETNAIVSTIRKTIGTYGDEEMLFLDFHCDQVAY